MPARHMRLVAVVLLATTVILLMTRRYQTSQDTVKLPITNAVPEENEVVPPAPAPEVPPEEPAPEVPPTPTKTYKWGVASSPRPDDKSWDQDTEQNRKFYRPAKPQSSDTQGDEEDEEYEDIDWSKFAYTQYATTSEYLCNSVMIFEALYRLGSEAESAMLYPRAMLEDPEAKDADTYDGKLLIKARDEYRVRLLPIDVQHRDPVDEDYTWTDSYTKLLAFNLTQYERVVQLDSDGIVLDVMDELFFLPDAPVAMPRAYWLLHDNPPRRVFASHVLVITPSQTEFGRIQDKIASVPEGEYDMEIMNQLYQDSALVMPHRKYAMLTAEFRATDHVPYLGSDREAWDPTLAYNEAKFVHYSDWPVPKPWLAKDEEAMNKTQPECQKLGGGKPDDCTARDIWNGFYTEHNVTREKVCSTTMMTKRSIASRRSRRLF